MTTNVQNEIAVRDQIVPVGPGRSFFDVLREVGVDAAELEVAPVLSVPHIKGEDGRPLFSLATASAVQALKERFEAEQIHVSALMLATDFSGEDAEAHVAWAVRAAHVARELGAPALRIDTWTRRTDLLVATIVDNFARRIRRVLDETTETGVDLGIENHGSLSNDPAFLDAVFAAVDDPRLGLTLDTGNFYWYGHPLSDVYAIIERFAPRAKHTHIKNIAYPAEIRETKRAIGFEYGRYAAPLDEGNIDVARVVRLLRQAGYRGDLCVENEVLSRYGGPEQQIKILRRAVQTLRTTLQNEAQT